MFGCAVSMNIRDVDSIEGSSFMDSASHWKQQMKYVDIPPHMAWDITEGALVSRGNAALRINVKNAITEPGSGLVLWTCEARAHELMYMSGSQIKLAANPNLCLNAEAGLLEGHRIITFPCGAEGELAASEEFLFDNGLLKALRAPHLCINIKGGEMRLGAEIQLWQCGDRDENELFHLDGAKIFMQKYPHLNLNVAGGDVTGHGQPLVLWTCVGADHELFEFTFDGRLRLKMKPEICLDSPGLRSGNRVVLNACRAQPADSEMWSYDSQTGLIYATKEPNLGFNAASGKVQAGDEIMLWPVIDEKRQSGIIQGVGHLDRLAELSAHMTFDSTETGLLVSRANNALRINVRNALTQSGSDLVLWQCESKSHELFQLSGTQIQLVANPQLCLNAERGLVEGHRLITYPCGADNGASEEFFYDNGLLKALRAPELCIDVKGGEMKSGAELQLWTCHGNENEMFHLDGTKIFLKKYPHLNFNVAGGDVAGHGSPVILWSCEGADHELFEFTFDGRLRMKTFPDLCLNAEGGVRSGNKIILFPCHSEPQDTELFTYDRSSGLIIATMDPNLGLNAAGGQAQAGDEIVLWPLSESRDLII